MKSIFDTLGLCLVALGVTLTVAACVTGESAKQLTTDVLAVACANAAPIAAQAAAIYYPPAAPFLPAANAAKDQYCSGHLAGATPSQAADRVNTAFAVLLGTGVMNH